MAEVISSIPLRNLADAGRLNITEKSSEGTIKGAIWERLNSDYPNLDLDMLDDLSVKLKEKYVEIIVRVDDNQNFSANDIRNAIL